MTQFGTMCLKCGQDVWNIYAWPKLSSDIVSHSLQGSSFHFRSWAQYWLCGSWSVWGLDERTPVKDNTSVLAPQFLNRSSSRMWFIQMEQKMRNVQCWGESFKNRRSLRRYKWCENAGDCPIVAAAQVSSSLLLLASCTTSRTSTMTQGSWTRVWTSCN